jgi:hypothetical protein
VNSNQKLTLLWTAAILVAMLLLPPFDNGEYGCIAAPRQTITIVPTTSVT